MPQNLWVGISESGHSTILIFTFLKSAFQTLTFGICLGSQHLKVTLSSGGHISRICQISALSGNILPFMSSLHFWHFCRKIHRFTLIGVIDNDFSMFYYMLRCPITKTDCFEISVFCFR